MFNNQMMLYKLGFVTSPLETKFCYFLCSSASEYLFCYEVFSHANASCFKLAI